MYPYRVNDPKEYFKSWLEDRKEYIEIAIEQGYTRQEAIEMMKLYALIGIRDGVGNIS